MPIRQLKVPTIDPRFACYRLRVARSGIQGFGVYACAPIPRRRKVIEYTGERINHREAIRRLKGKHSRYLFYLDKRWVLDGRICGNGAQFINHSCDPNLYSCRRSGHLLLVSRRRIRPGEELSFDYHFSPDAIREPCHCGSPKCRGTINLRRRGRPSKVQAEKG